MIEKTIPIGGSDERGSIMPLLIIIGIIVLIFSGLAIDSTMVTTAKVQHRQLSEYVALEALHTYVKTAGTFDVKLNAAKQRAQEISSLNLLIGTRLAGMTTGVSDIQTNRPSDPIGANGTLTPGIWWYREPPAACDPVDPCPCVCTTSGGPFSCGIAGAWTKQFFQPVDLDTYPNCKVNAFEAALKTDSASSIPTLFMQATGITAGTTFTSVATAATYPRHGVFLVDLARASHAESHIPYESVGGGGQNIYMFEASEYSFHLRSDTCATYNANSCNAKNSCSIVGGIVPGLYEAIWYTDRDRFLAGDVSYAPDAALGTCIGSGPRDPTEPATKRYKADYQCFDINYNDTRYSPSLVSGSYLVDMYRDPANSNLGPEPLSSMLWGVNYGYTLMAGGGDEIPGDKLGLVGFDESASITERIFPMSRPSDVIYKDAQNVTDVSANPACISNPAQNADWCRVQNHFFITRDRGGSNIAEALQVAYAQLQAAATNQPAQNFVMLFSNGLTNCGLNRSCGDTEADFSAAYADVGTTITGSYVPGEIAFDFVGMGESAGAHTLVVPSPSHVDPSTGLSTSCMTEQEADDYNPPLFYTDFDGGAGATTFVDAARNIGGAFSGGNKVKARGTQYFGSNKLYEFVQATGGYWMPIRKNPCSVDGAGNGIDITPTLKAACAGQVFAEAGGPPIGRPTSVLNVPPYTDGFGRLTCDPQGLSRLDQVKAAVNKVLGRSPFIIVE